MNRGLYIAASGMLAEQLRQDLLANDLANVSTPGYKADRAAQASFDDVLLGNTATGATVGPLGQGVQIAEVVTDFTPGPLRETGETLDLALEGDGFLAVSTTAGTRYWRGGAIAVDAYGRLTTANGLPLLDEAGGEITAGQESGLAIAADGTVTVNGTAAGKLGVVSLTDPVKEGDSLFTGTPGQRPAGTAVRQGFLEGSGVDAARAMIDMLVSMRAFEASQRVIRTIDETLGRAINSAGQVS